MGGGHGEGVRWTIGECVRCDIWGKGADTDQHSDGLRIIRISLNVWLEPSHINLI